MDIINIIGLVVSIAGFSVALWQLVRTRRAAEAARDAAAEALRTVNHVQAVASIQDICGRSRDLLHLTRARNLIAAATAAFELRDLIARFHGTDGGRQLLSINMWQATANDVRLLHERLESAAAINRLDAAERTTLIHEVARLHTQFSTLAGHTTAIGVNDAHP